MLLKKLLSINLKNNSPEILPIIKKQKEVLDLLKKHNILNKNLKWIPDNKNHKKKFITVLIHKLKTLNLIEYKNYKIFQENFEKLINCKFDYNKSTVIITSFEEKNADKNSISFLDNLSFLDSLTNK